jgi:hypothetical protein
MTRTNDLHKLEVLLHEGGKQFFWVLEYGITHHLMTAAIHKGDYPRCNIIELDDCIDFSGRLQGGPYSLTMRREQTDEGELVVITGDDSRLVVTCGRVRVVRVRK